MSKIEWTEQTWNPIAGCTRVSKGCDNCYAIRMSYRLEHLGVPLYEGLTHRRSNGTLDWTGKIAVADDAKFNEPLRRKKPTVYFVNSMSDLFHHGVSDAVVNRIFGIMERCPQHRFQVLTKRPERMHDYVNARYPNTACPRHILLGVSIEDQETADKRLPILHATRAYSRFISAEPLLGQVDLWRVRRSSPYPYRNDGFEWWLIAGGESGPGARPMDSRWARSLRDQCSYNGIPFFFKQWGGRGPKAGGRLLYGVEHNGYPQVLLELLQANPPSVAKDSLPTYPPPATTLF